MADGLRLDKFLWFARIVKTRALAQALAEQGRIRIGGRLVDRAHAPVRVGDVLSFAQRGTVRVLRVEALPARRGPPAEARALYTEMVEGSEATNSSPEFPGEGDRAKRHQASPGPPPRQMSGRNWNYRPLTSEGGGD